MRALVVGGAGFIGSHLCDALLSRGVETWCVDNLHLGQRRHIAHLLGRPDFGFREVDVLQRDAVRRLFEERAFDVVFHLAANSDIRAGTSDASVDLRLNLLTTLEILEAMRSTGARRIVFASTSAVFGENEAFLQEDSGPLKPISFYGASKLGAEAYLSVYAHTFGIMATIVRFPNVVGERATHGILFDFLRKLAATPKQLDVLGDGRQQKPYLYVSDLVEALWLVVERQQSVFEVYHAAGEGSTSVREIAEIVVEAAGSPETAIVFGSADRGWPGDVPRFAYDTRKLAALGWRPRYASTAAIRHAVRRILENGF
jgi:UDP-glucose 4-epimerase